MVQLSLAYLILVKHKGVFVFLPWLSIGAVVMGWVTGAVAASVCRRLRDLEREGLIPDVVQDDSPSPRSYQYLPGESFLHRALPETKLAVMIVLSLVLLISQNWWVYGALSLSLMVIVVFSKTPFSFLVQRARKYSFMILIAFSLPLFFNSGTHTIVNTPYFRMTQEGLSTGATFAFRILFLISVSSLLVRTTSPEELTRGLAKMLSFLRYVGISEKRVATMLSLSWVGIPFFWDTARRTIRSAKIKKTRNLRQLVPVLSNLIATLYLEASPESAYWHGAPLDEQQHLVPQSAKVGSEVKAANQH
jgi:energy-coupling factor transport system permease protein